MSRTPSAMLRARIVLVEEVEPLHTVSRHPVPEERPTVATAFDGHQANMERPIRLVDHNIRRDRASISSFRDVTVCCWGQRHLPQAIDAWPVGQAIQGR